MMAAQWQRQCFAYHPVIGYWYVAGLNARIVHERGAYWVRTNSLGMRANREYSIQKPAQRLRLAVFGDSVTAGDGVNNDERFSNVLESFCDRLEVLNFALPGSGTDQQLLVYRTLARNYEVDGYLWTPWIENIGRNKGRFRPATDRVTGEIHYVPKPYFENGPGGLVLKHQPVPRHRILADEAPQEVLDAVDFTGSYRNYRIRRWINRRLPFLKAPLQRLFPRHPYGDYLSSESKGWQLMKAIFKDFVEDVNGARPIFIAPLPTYHYIESNLPDVYMDRFKELSDENRQVFVLNVTPYFRNFPSQTRRACRYKYDTHYTPRGHGIVGEAIYREVERVLPSFWSQC